MRVGRNTQVTLWWAAGDYTGLKGRFSCRMHLPYTFVSRRRGRAHIDN